MKRIFSAHAYGPGPRAGCWWDETIAAPDWPQLQGDLSVDVAIIGGGFTGLSAALTLAQGGLRVAVLEEAAPGWGASGRNGGFCCLGGSMMDIEEMTARYGAEASQHYYDTERAAIDLVARRLDDHGIDADRHSNGETLLAHSPRAMEAIRAHAGSVAQRHGCDVQILEQSDLAAAGLGGEFHGAMTVPLGFALNPRKYLLGLAAAAQQAGVMLFQKTQATAITPGAQAQVTTPKGTVTCAQAIVATNGYSSENLPDWLAGRYLPAQSSVLVTRPLTDAELDAQGWTSGQASYDSRNLLHYFRLMPDRRFLFGMRGGLLSTPRSEARSRAKCRADFERMFPAWAHVDSPHHWSGMVCLSRTRTPYVGPVPDQPGVFAALSYHGNGVAMASWSGTALARMILDPAAAQDIPPPMQAPLTRFPLGRARRALLPPIYTLMQLADLR